MTVRVTKLDDQPAPCWEAAKVQLLALKDGDSLTLAVDDDTFLIVLHIGTFGYLVTGCGKGELDYYTLIERALGDEPVTAFDGGDTHSYPRFVFVSPPLLLKAAEIYYRTGMRDTACEWVLDRDAFYE